MSELTTTQMELRTKVRRCLAEVHSAIKDAGYGSLDPYALMVLLDRSDEFPSDYLVGNLAEHIEGAIEEGDDEPY